MMDQHLLLAAFSFICISCLYAQESGTIDSYNNNHILSTGTEINGKIPKQSRLKQFKIRSGVPGVKESSDSYVSDEISSKREYVRMSKVGFEHLTGGSTEFHSNTQKEKEIVRRNRREAHPSSPCPSVFAYEGTESNNGKWSGVITLTSGETVNGINIEIILDGLANFIESSLGKVSGRDTDYKIWSSKTKLESGTSLSVRITVNYKEDGNQPPRIQLIKLNGRKICPSGYGGSVVLTIPSVPSSGSTRPTQSTTVSTPVTQSMGQTGATELVDGVPCGKIEVQPAPFIHFAQPSYRGQWPWHAAIFLTQNNGLNYWCGASLIGKETVLTAAHCVVHERTGIPYKIEDFVIYLGKYDFKLWNEGGIQIKRVKDMQVYPDYDYLTFKSDIAILKLSSPADFTRFVKPVCLWDKNRPQLSEIEGKEGVVVGWGVNENHKVSEELMMAKMPVVSQNTCVFSNPDLFSANEKTFCAGFRNGTGVCFGDSGGGMYFPKNDVSNDDELITWSLRGLVSYGITKKNRKECNTKEFAVFTDIAKFYDWIQNYR